MLIKLGRPIRYTVVPLAFLLFMTVYALFVQLGQFYREQNWLLLVMDIVILGAALWVALEAVVVIRRGGGRQPGEVGPVEGR
jgi:carbon starvation protein